jgi:beta-glucosidase
MRIHNSSSNQQHLKEGVYPMRKLCSMAIQILLFANFAAALGQSPAAPSLRTSGELERRVDSLLSQMTLEEKIDLLGGVDGFFIRDVARLKLPRLKMADG